MDRDETIDAVRDVLEDYFRQMDDLNDTDTDDLAESIVMYLERKGVLS